MRGRIDADGPALRVRVERRAEMRFPLDRVSRIVAGAHVTWSADALRACLERAIPIVIVKRDGSPLGSVQPARVRPARLADALEELLDWPDWHDIYRCWLRAARMRVVTEWRREQETQGAKIDLASYLDFVKRHVYRAEPPPAAHEMSPLWRGALYALALEAIERWGAPPMTWTSGGEAIDLRRDLAELLELRLRLEVSLGASLEGERTMLFVFHALAGKLEFDAGRALRSLARRTNQVLAECR